MVQEILFCRDAVQYTNDRKESRENGLDTSTNFGLTIRIKKTVMRKPAPGKTYIEASITINGQCLKAVDNVTYLGSTLSRNVVIDDEVDARLAKANYAFGRLSNNVWNRSGITQETKIKVYHAAVMTTHPVRFTNLDSLLMLCSKTQSLPHHTPQEAILRIKWQDKIPDTEVLAHAGLPTSTPS